MANPTSSSGNLSCLMKPQQIRPQEQKEMTTGKVKQLRRMISRQNVPAGVPGGSTSLTRRMALYVHFVGCQFNSSYELTRRDLYLYFANCVSCVRVTSLFGVVFNLLPPSLIHLVVISLSFGLDKWLGSRRRRRTTTTTAITLQYKKRLQAIWVSLQPPPVAVD